MKIVPANLLRLCEESTRELDGEKCNYIYVLARSRTASASKYGRLSVL